MTELRVIVVAQKPWGKKRLDDIVGTGAGALNVGNRQTRTVDGWDSSEKIQVTDVMVVI